MRALEGLAGEGRNLLLLDSVIEKTFATEEGQAPESSWVGFLHCARNVPAHFDARKSPRHYLATERWKRSREHCLGLLVLAPSMVGWVRDLAQVPVTAVWHPAEFGEVDFSMDRYLAGGRQVVQVGWWLRRLASIHFLPISAERKRLLIPHSGENRLRFERCLRRECEIVGAPGMGDWTGRIEERLENSAYDEMLSRSVVFAEFYDVAACNAVLECMTRRTPVLVNRLPALEDYLGAAYPLFYRDLEEAGDFARDDERVAAAHEYLRGLDLARLRAERFREDVAAAFSLPASP